MEPEELRRLLRTTGADLWTILDAAITVAASDHGRELRARRDAIVERLYASPLTPPPSAPAVSDRSRQPESRNGTARPPLRREDGAKKPAPLTPSPESMNRSEEEEDGEEEEDHRSRGRGLPLEAADDEESRVLAIKELLEDPDQSEDSLADLLQNLADMDITFKALKETDIGRHVNGLRKHPSSEVRGLVKILVRKWKDTVDEWVMSNSDAASPAVIPDGDSPQQLSGKNHNQNGYHQVRELGHSPNPNNSCLSSERNGLEPAKAKPTVIAPQRREATPTNKPNNINHTAPSSATPIKVKEQDMLLEERLASAKKRLHENYQEAENAKKQRTIQVMDINEIPKGKNSSFVRKGGSQAKHW